MKYKLIAIDMDGTLLNSKHEVSDKNKEVIRKAIDNGVKVVVSTGRIFVSARYYARLLGTSTPIIACNGAYVKGELNKENMLLDLPIKNSDVKKIIEILENNNAKYRFYDDKNFYTKKINNITEKYMKWNEIQKEEDKINIILLKDFNKIINSNLNVYKFVVMEEDDNKLRIIKETILNECEVEIVSSFRNSFDIMYKNVSKGNALKLLCSNFNINNDEVIAIGDNENDLSMIEYAGVGVAMGNGEEKVKLKADLVTDTNDNDGVAKIINKLLFNV